MRTADFSGYEQVEAAASAPWFADVLAGLADSSARVALPKLDMTTRAALREPLKALGMNLPFEAEADFSSMTSEPVKITQVHHQAVLKLVEGGTVAAAATSVVVGTKGAAPMAAHMLDFDRPFLFAVVDRPTSQILFLGRVLDPAAH